MHSSLVSPEPPHIRAAHYLNFLALLNDGRSSNALLPTDFVLRGVPFWPTYVNVASAKTFVAMTTGGVREGCADLKGSMLLPSYRGSCLHEPTQTAQQNIEPRNLYFESVPAVSIRSQTDLFFDTFFCPSEVRGSGCWRREEKSKGGLWCIIYLCSGWAEDVGCALGEEKWVGRLKKSGSQRVGRGNLTLRFPCYPSLCRVLQVLQWENWSVWMSYKYYTCLLFCSGTSGITRQRKTGVKIQKVNGRYFMSYVHLF